MLANFFGKSKPINFISILILFLCYFFIISFQQFLKYSSIIDFLTYQSAVLILILTLFLLFNFIVLKNHLTLDNTYAFLFFVIGFGLFPNAMTSLKTGFINFGLLLFFKKIYNLQSLKLVFKRLFDSGFILGIIFIFEPLFLVFGVLLYSCIFLYQKITFQKVLIPILGFFAPLFLYFTYCFWIDDFLGFQDLFYSAFSYHFYVYKNINHLLSIMITGVFIGALLLIKTLIIFNKGDYFIKNWIIIILNLFIAIALLFFTRNQNEEQCIPLLFPASIILANAIELIQKKWISELILILFLGYSFISVLKIEI